MTWGGEKQCEWEVPTYVLTEEFGIPSAPLPGLAGKLGLKSKSREWQVFNRRFGRVFEGPDSFESWAYCGASETDEAMPWELGV